MKRTLIIIASLFLLAFGTASFAQHHGGMGMGQGMGQGNGQGMGMGPGGPGMSRILNLLQLTPDQKIQWDALHTELAATVQPLFDQIQSERTKLQALVTAANPDATAIGKEVLAIQAIANQIRAAHDATELKIEAILTPDQKAKFDAWKATRPTPTGFGLGFCGGMGPGNGSCANCPIH